MKNTLLTMGVFALLLAGQSAMAVEQTNSENGYDSAFRNGWSQQDSSQASGGLEMSKVIYVDQDTSASQGGPLDSFSLDYISTY